MPTSLQQLFLNYVSLKGLILIISLATTDVDVDPADEFAELQLTKIASPNFPRKKGDQHPKSANREG
jgi:hypothetical protein